MFRRIINALNIFKRLKVLEEKVNKMSKRTLSQLTLQDEEGASVKQIIDEWLNGEEESNGN